MPYYETRRSIDADTNLVWSILTDTDLLANGDFSIIKIEGQISSGSTIKLWSEVNPERAFMIKVSEFQPGRRMTWANGMPFGLFKGARTFELASNNNRTEFLMREEYTGLLKNLMFKMIPDLQPSFEKFGDALKAHAERSIQ